MAYPQCTPSACPASTVIPKKNKSGGPPPSPLTQLELERILDEADALPLPPPPPMTKRGAEPSSHGVDYLGMTHQDTTGRIWCDLLGVPEEEWVELDHGMRHYPKARCYGSIRVGYGGDPRMGSHIDIKGQGCRELESAGIVTCWAQFAAKCLECGAKASRLDLYIDDRSGSITVEELREKWRAGHARSRSKRAGSYEQWELGEGESRGATLTIGSRVSDTYVRCYDKARQQCPRDLAPDERKERLQECGPCVRVEVELKDERAQFALELLARRGFGWGLVASFINSHVEFKEGDARGHNGNRVPTWEPWAKLMGSPERITMARGVMASSLAQSERNLERMWGPTILTIIASRGGDIEWLRRLALRSKGRVREKHARMLAEAERVAEQWAA